MFPATRNISDHSLMARPRLDFTTQAHGCEQRGSSRVLGGGPRLRSRDLVAADLPSSARAPSQRHERDLSIRCGEAPEVLQVAACDHGGFEVERGDDDERFDRVDGGYSCGGKQRAGALGHRSRRVDDPEGVAVQELVDGCIGTDRVPLVRVPEPRLALRMKISPDGQPAFAQRRQACAACLSTTFRPRAPFNHTTCVASAGKRPTKDRPGRSRRPNAPVTAR
jgi:hypothetical protein